MHIELVDLMSQGDGHIGSAPQIFEIQSSDCTLTVIDRRVADHHAYAQNFFVPSVIDYHKKSPLSAISVSPIAKYDTIQSVFMPKASLVVTNWPKKISRKQVYLINQVM